MGVFGRAAIGRHATCALITPQPPTFHVPPAANSSRPRLPHPLHIRRHHEDRPEFSSERVLAKAAEEGALLHRRTQFASPMKPATNSLLGRSYKSCGVPACAITPWSNTMIWSLSASASLWSWVTYAAVRPRRCFSLRISSSTSRSIQNCQRREISEVFMSLEFLPECASRPGCGH